MDVDIQSSPWKHKKSLKMVITHTLQIPRLEIHLSLHFHILFNTISFSADRVKLYPACTCINYSADWLRLQTTHLKHGIVIVLFLCDVISTFIVISVILINNTTQKKQKRNENQV